MKRKGNQDEKFLAVKTALLLHMPFFASLLMDLLEVEVDDYSQAGIFPPGMRPTMATDGKKIYIDEKFLESIGTDEAVGAVCHEISHKMFEHMARAKSYYELGFEGKPFYPIVWNIAGDFIINDMLKQSGIKLPGCAIFSQKYKADWAIEDVYRELLKENPPPPPQQGGGEGEGDGQGDQDGQGGGENDAEGGGGGGRKQGDKMPENGFDHHIYKESQTTPAELKRAVQSAVDAAKACGKLPGGLERFAKELVEPQVNWKEQLRHLVVTRSMHETSTWTRPHKRRLVSQRMYLPRASSFGCGDIVVVIDTSGSIGERELTAFMSELADILRTCRPERVFVLGADAVVASVVELDGHEDIEGNQPQVKGGGGTDFRPAFDWVRENGIEPDALVYLTDLYGPFPDHPPGYPVVWGATTEQGVPWGDVVRIKV